MTFRDIEYFIDFYINHADEDIIVDVDDYGFIDNSLDKECFDKIMKNSDCLPETTIWNNNYGNIEIANLFISLSTKEDDESDTFMPLSVPYVFYNDNIDTCLVIDNFDLIPSMDFILINKDNIKDDKRILNRRVEIEEKELLDAIKKLNKLSPYSIHSFDPYIYINIDDIFDMVLDNLNTKMMNSDEITFEDNIIETLGINNEVNLALYSESNKDLSDYFYKLKLLVTI